MGLTTFSHRYFAADYKDWLQTVSTLFKVLLGDFDFSEFGGTVHEYFAPTLVCFYGFCMLFIMLNVFIAILSKGFEQRWDAKADRSARMSWKEAMFEWALRTTESYQKEKKQHTKEDEMMKQVEKGEIELCDVRPESVEATIIGMANDATDLLNDSTSGVGITIETQQMVSITELINLLHETIAERGGTHVKPRGVAVGLVGEPKVLLIDDDDCNQFAWQHGLTILAIMNERLVRDMYLQQQAASEKQAEQQESKMPSEPADANPSASGVELETSTRRELS